MLEAPVLKRFDQPPNINLSEQSAYVTHMPVTDQKQNGEVLLLSDFRALRLMREAERAGATRSGHGKRWTISIDGMGDPKTERLNAVQMTLANGILTHQPGEGLALQRGLFEQKPQEEGPDKPSTTPNALILPDSYAYFVGEAVTNVDLRSPNISRLKRQFDPRYRIRDTSYIWTDEQGKSTDVRVTQFNSQSDPHQTVQHISITPHFDGDFTFGTGISGSNLNGDGVLYEKLETAGINGQGILLGFDTKYKKETGFVTQYAEFRDAKGIVGYEPVVEKSTDRIHQKFRINVKEGQSYTLTTVSSYHSTADGGIIEGRDDHPIRASLNDLSKRKPFEILLGEHKEAWDMQHDHIQVRVEGDDEVQQALEFNHSTVSSSVRPGYPHAGIGAKEGFSPEIKAYGQRHFWDAEIYDIDNLTPEQLKTILLYRYNQLPDARRKAEKYTGVKEKPGAFGIWEGSRPGYMEGCPETVLCDGKIVPIESLREEIHISGDIAFFAWDYYRRTGDRELLRNQGAELIVEAARFYRNRAAYNQESDRYEFHDVTGPDEYHPGVKNNAFTNGLAKWTVMKVKEMDAKGMISDETRARLGLDAEEIEKLSKFADKIHIPFDPKTFTFSAFDGWEKLSHIDLSHYPGVTLMDVALRQEYLKRTGKKPEELTADEQHPVRKTDVVKQHDTTLLVNLLGADTLKILPPDVLAELRRTEINDAEILQRIREASVRKYFGQTCDGSSLSPNKGVEIALEAGADPDEVYENYKHAINMDLNSNTHGTENGLHTAAAGGSMQATKRGFGGIKEEDEALVVNPRLPSKWHGLHIKSFYMGSQYKVDINKEDNTITVGLAEPAADASITVNIRGHNFKLNAQNSSVSLPYREDKTPNVRGVQEQVVYAGI